MGAISPCPDRRDLQRMLLGWVVDAECEAIEAHCADCPRCLETMRALEAEDTLVSAVRLGGDSPSVPADLANTHLMERLYGLGVFLARPAEAPATVVVPGFEVLERLGVGGMGVVYKARQLRPRRLVALKVLRDLPGGEAELLSRFRTEGELAARLEHPHIVRVYEVGLSPPYYAMELVEGGTLADRLRLGPLPPADAAQLLETLARAVHYAHTQGVVHRDLKPGNILLAVPSSEFQVPSGEGTAPVTLRTHNLELTTPTPKVTDFGLAKELSDAGGPTRTGAVLGTPCYMAPEQAKGQKEVGPAADIYSLGVILYEALVGHPPFQGATPLETLELVRYAEPLPPRRLRPGVPRDLETICLKCLQKEPAKRYATAVALADDLRRYAEGRPIAARPASRVERLVKWARRRPTAAALLVVCAVGFVLLGGGAAVYERQLRQALHQAEANRQRADDNYREAREAMQKMLARTDDRRRAGLPRLQELRREQQEDALAFFLKMAEQLGDSLEVRADVAMACFKAGWLQQQLGRIEEARRNVERARDLYAALAEERPDRPIYLSQLAFCWSTLGHCSADDDEKLRCFREGLRVSEALVRDHPDVAAYQAELARSHHDLGSFAQQHNQPAEAEEHYRRALALWVEVQRQRPGDGESLHGLASAQVNLCALLKGQPGRQAEVKELHDQAEANLERQLRDDPTNIPDAFSLAVLRINWAYVLLEAKQYDDAIAEMTRNVAMLTPLREREPDHQGLRLVLLNSHGVWATVLEAQQKPAEEAEHRRMVRDLSPPEGRVRHQVYFAWALARAGDHARALTEAEAVTDFTDPMLAFHLAQACAVASVKAGADEKLTTADRSATAERCAVAAVRFLSRFKEKLKADDWPEARALIREDSHLKPLAGRDDLKRLLGP